MRLVWLARMEQEMDCQAVNPVGLESTTRGQAWQPLLHARTALLERTQVQLGSSRVYRAPAVWLALILARQESRQVLPVLPAVLDTTQQGLDLPWPATVWPAALEHTG